MMPLRILFLLLACSASCAQAVVGGVVLELRAEAAIEGPRAMLPDLARISGNAAALKALRKLDLGRVPRVGYTDRVSRAAIEQALRRQTGTLPVIEWRGATAVAVRSVTATVGRSRLEHAAMSAFTGQFAARFPGIEAQVLASAADLDVPVGKVQVRARNLGDATPLARLPVWLDVLVDGAVFRTVVVPLSVSLVRPVYVARRAFDAGDVALASDFEVGRQDVIGKEALPVVPEARPKQWRLRRPVQAGQVLQAAAVARPGAVLRGDAVRVIARVGAIEIETPAVALADAVPGQNLAVRPSGATSAVNGRLGLDATVELDR